MAANRGISSGRDRNGLGAKMRGGASLGGDGGSPVGDRRTSKLEDQMRDNLAKLQLKLMQQKLTSRQNSRASQVRPSLHSADLRLRNAIKDRDHLLAELKFEKSKDELASNSAMLQRPYLSTDEYPPMTALPGMNPQVAFPSTGSRNLDALETGLGLDRQYDHGDMLLRDSLKPRRSRSTLWAPPMPPPSLMAPPPFYSPFHSGYPHHPPYPPLGAPGYQNSDMMGMMMMQNAQMNQTLMQTLLMSSLAAPRSHSTAPSYAPPEVHVVPGPSSGMPYNLPSLSMGQMPNSLQHPSFGPGSFPTQMPAFTVEQQ